MMLHGSDLTDLVGGAALRGVTIDSAQIVPLALAMFDALGIIVSAIGSDRPPKSG